MKAFFFVMFFSLVLAACASPETAPPETVQPELTAKPQPSQPTPPPASQPEEEQARIPAIAMLPPERALRDGLNGPDAPDPAHLIGLDAGEIKNMLGPPDFKRHDPPAEIWQYRQDGCLLDVFFFLTAGGDGAYRVSHVEARSHDVVQVSGAECLLEALAR